MLVEEISTSSVQLNAVR